MALRFAGRLKITHVTPSSRSIFKFSYDLSLIGHPSPFQAIFDAPETIGNIPLVQSFRPDLAKNLEMALRAYWRVRATAGIRRPTCLSALQPRPKTTSCWIA